MKRIALIPARKGSKRIKNKNIKLLNGHPLIAYTIIAAKKSKLFDKIFVVTDSREYMDISLKYGADKFKLRPSNTSLSDSPDISWLLWFSKVYKNFSKLQYVSILRPTSPFRDANTIKRAHKKFMKSITVIDSLRAVSKSHIHPGKMWIDKDELILPLLPFYKNDGTPWHSSQTNTLPLIYYQNASLEIIKPSTILKKKSLSGNIIKPFYSKNYEGVDINTKLDFDFANFLLKSQKILHKLNVKL